MKKIILIIITTTIFITGCGLKEEVENNEEKINQVKETTSEIPDAYPDSKEVTISKEEYEKIVIGLTYEEVINIIGGSCTKTIENTVENMTQTIYGCNGETKGSSILLTFINDKLATKIEKGL